jgi:hypothetical protein
MTKDMNKKTISRVNGGLAIYYGIGSIVVAIGGIVGIGVWLFKVFTDQTNFSWGTLVGLTIVTVTMGAIGYSILRVGFDEMEK